MKVEMHQRCNYDEWAREKLKFFDFRKKIFDAMARRGGWKMRSLSIRRVGEDDRVKTGCWRPLPFPYRRFDIRCRSSCVLFSDISRSRWGGREPSGSMNGNLVTQRYRNSYTETMKKADRNLMVEILNNCKVEIIILFSLVQPVKISLRFSGVILKYLKKSFKKKLLPHFNQSTKIFFNSCFPHQV